MPPMDLTKFIEAEKWRRELQSQKALQEAKSFLSRKFNDQNIKMSTVVCAPHEIGDRVLEQIIIQQADCVLIGSRGLGLMRRAMLGSLSNYIVQHSNVPVVVCKRDPFAPAPGAPPPSPLTQSLQQQLPSSSATPLSSQLVSESSTVPPPPPYRKKISDSSEH